MQPSLMHNYNEDFGDCPLIDNGRVTPQFPNSVTQIFLYQFEFAEIQYSLKVILHSCKTETFKTIRACKASFIDNL